MKIVLLDKKHWPSGRGYGHWCPGCGQGHEVWVEPCYTGAAAWTFDGNLDRPTFSPSVKISWGKHAGQADTDRGGVCHYFIKAGRIEFQGDCTHGLAKQTIDLPDIPPGHYVTSVWCAERGLESS